MVCQMTCHGYDKRLRDGDVHDECEKQEREGHDVDLSLEGRGHDGNADANADQHAMQQENWHRVIDGLWCEVLEQRTCKNKDLQSTMSTSSTAAKNV